MASGKEALGTAPARVRGQWVTQKGRVLTPAGQAYWEGLLKQGRTDGRGHMFDAEAPAATSRPAGMSDATWRTIQLSHMPGASAATVAAPPPKKPSFNTALAAAKGDKVAQQKVKAWERHQKAVKAGEQQASDVLDTTLFDTAASTVRKSGQKTGLDPIASAVINAVSPVQAALDAYQQAQKHKFVASGVSALGVLPIGPGKFGRIASGVTKAEDVIRAERAAQAAARLEQAGNMSAAAKLLGSTGSAGEAYGAQAKLRSAELAARAGKIQEALKTPGEAGYQAARQAMRGKMPTIPWHDLTTLTDHQVGLLDDVIRGSDLQPYDQMKVQAAIRAARESVLLRPHEIALIEHVFGKEAAAQVTSRWTKFGLNVMDAANIPRTVMSSFDLSAPFRQGIVAGASHPTVFAKNFAPMFKAAFSERRYNEIMQEIMHRPSFANMQRAGVNFSEMGGGISGREEMIASKFARKIPGVKHSAQGYSVFLNRMRADIFDSMQATLRENGIDTPEERRQIARFVNWSTGRGDLKAFGLNLEGAAVPLNSMLFSPRLLASRFQAFNPFFYKSLSPTARKQALWAMFRLVGTGMGVLALAKMGGAKVGVLPTSADFGKIRIGNTRIDIWGGHQQFARLAAQLIQGKVTSSTTGKTMRIGGVGGHTVGGLEILTRFFRSKLSPLPGLVADAIDRKDFIGNPLTVKSEVSKVLVPMIAGDVWDMWKQTGGDWNKMGSVPAAAGLYGLAAFGFGAQTYGNTQKGGLPPDLPGGRSGGGALARTGGSRALTRTGGSRALTRAGGSQALTR